MNQGLQKGMGMVQAVLNKVAEFLVNYSFEVVGALIVLFIGWKLAQWVGKALLRFLEQKHFDLGLRYWVPTRRYFQVMYATNLAIYKALKAANITIPFPQREVRILSPES